MPDPVVYFKIFLSSPGDVPQERNDAEVIIQEINESGEFSHHFLLKLFRWDDKTVVLPMPVTDIPQKSVDIYMTLPSQCDLTIVVLWSRMGSPLVMDEREYLSGTHYEYSEALAAYRESGKPTVWLYRCAEEPSIKLSDPDRDRKIQQYDRVVQFFKQFQDAEGRYTAGVNEYPAHTDFRSLFKGQLITYLRHLRDNPRTETTTGTVRTIFTGIPYRGLNALDETDAPIFFGRDAESLEVLGRVDNKRLVMVLGASGSGKSSLVAAGVLPKLRERGWRILRCVPGDDPFYNLAQAMVSQLSEMDVKPTDYLTEAQKLTVILRERSENFARQIALTLPKQRVVLFIDQFEEVFTLAASNPQISSERRNEVKDFIEVVSRPSAQLTTLITMRADFYAAALPYFEVLKQEAYGLTKPSLFALFDLITRPAQLAGLSLDEGLARQMLDDVGDESGALALIAYVMQSLYLRAKARGDTRLVWDDYRTLGGVNGAINTLADRAYANLPFDDVSRQQALRTVFRELITLTEEDGQLIPTRRRAALSLFAPDSHEKQLIAAFVNARLLVQDSQTVEVAHEAILRHWDELAGWIATVKGELALFRQYERDARLWAERGRDTPLPSHEALVYFYKALESLGIVWENLPEPLKSFTEPEQRRLYRELEQIETSHKRRYDIGDRLSVIGDTRPGIGVLLSSRTVGTRYIASTGEGQGAWAMPDILWLPVVAPEERRSLFGKQKISFKDQFGKIYGEFEVKPFFIAQYLITLGVTQLKNAS
jgi:Novel STAND NTPase 1